MPLFADKSKNTFSGNNLNSQISSIVDKKNALLMSVGNEINNLNLAISNLYKEIGGEVYRTHLEGAIKTDGLTGYFDNIAELNKSITAKEAQSEEITKRYDEEIKLLQNLAQPPQTHTAPVSVVGTGTAFCTKCGTAYVPGEIAFCTGCGNKFVSS